MNKLEKTSMGMNSLKTPDQNFDSVKETGPKGKLSKVFRTAAAGLALFGLAEAGSPALAAAEGKTKEKPGASMAELISRSQELEKNIIKITKEKGEPGKINGIKSKKLTTEEGQVTVLFDKSGIVSDMIFEQIDGERLIFYYDGGTDGPDARPERLVFDNQKGGLRNSPARRSAEGMLDALVPIEQTQKIAATEADLSPRAVSVLEIKRDQTGNVDSVETADFKTGEAGRIDEEIEQKIADQTIQQQLRDGLSRFEDSLKK